MSRVWNWADGVSRQVFVSISKPRLSTTEASVIRDTKYSGSRMTALFRQSATFQSISMTATDCAATISTGCPNLARYILFPWRGEQCLRSDIERLQSRGLQHTDVQRRAPAAAYGVMGIGSRYDVDDIVGYRPEYSWNFEVGSHLSFPSARLNIDVSLFYIDCTDQQLTMFPDGNTTGRIMTNAGRTRSFGGELSASWTPVDRLAFTASYGYTNARFIDFFNGIENFSGKFVPYAPQNTTVYSGSVDNTVASQAYKGSCRRCEHARNRQNILE